MGRVHIEAAQELRTDENIWREERGNKEGEKCTMHSFVIFNFNQTLLNTK
jgi:hypothetical protein